MIIQLEVFNDDEMMCNIGKEKLFLFFLKKGWYVGGGEVTCICLWFC